MRAVGPPRVLMAWAGESVAVNDIVDAACSAAGRDLPVRHVAPEPDETPAAILDISGGRALGYAPAHGLRPGPATVGPEFSEGEK